MDDCQNRDGLLFGCGYLCKKPTNGTFDKLSKRERLQMMREKDKLQKRLGSVSDMTKLPAAVFVWLQ